METEDGLSFSAETPLPVGADMVMHNQVVPDEDAFGTEVADRDRLAHIVHVLSAFTSLMSDLLVSRRDLAYAVGAFAVGVVSHAMTDIGIVHSGALQAPAYDMEADVPLPSHMHSTSRMPDEYMRLLRKSNPKSYHKLKKQYKMDFDKAHEEYNDDNDMDDNDMNEFINDWYAGDDIANGEEENLARQNHSQFFKDGIMKREVISDEQREIGLGCDREVHGYTNMWSYGHLRVNRIDRKRQTQDLCIISSFKQQSRASTQNTHLIEEELSYVGTIAGIYELGYRICKRVVLKVDWFCVDYKGARATMRQECSGFWSVDSSKPLRVTCDLTMDSNACSKNIDEAGSNPPSNGGEGASNKGKRKAGDKLLGPEWQFAKIVRSFIDWRCKLCGKEKSRGAPRIREHFLGSRNGSRYNGIGNANATKCLRELLGGVANAKQPKIPFPNGVPTEHQCSVAST
ncbi:hypothetical protein L7F22_001763 [Adiantum nelumboides]|nr:hypothetical protein [Adiantum nelumboides]